MAVCPRCAAPCAEGAIECSGCGVVLARARKRPEAPRPPAAPSAGGAKLLVETLAVLALLGGGAFAWAKYGRAMPESTPATTAAIPASRVNPGKLQARAPDPPASASGRPSAALPNSPNTPGLSDPGTLKGTPSLPTYSGWLTGAAGYQEALAKQQESASPVLVYFFTDWCPYCKQFDASVAPSSDSRLLRVRVNPEASDSDKQLAAQFGVRGYPSVFMLSRAGGAPERIEDGVSREKPPDPSAYTASCKERVVNDLWRAGNSAPGPETPDLDRALQFDSQEGGLWQARAAIRWRAGYRKSAVEDARRACSLGKSEACRLGG